jgi:hypothetical protein
MRKQTKPEPKENTMSLHRLQIIAEHLCVTFLKSIGATNLQPSSERSLRFDIPTSKHGINRVKVTETNGTATITFLQITEIDAVVGVLPENIESVINAFTKLEAAPVPMTSIESVLAAFAKPTGK